MDKEELIKFEEEIADLFEQGKIKFPIHLAGGNEDELIKIFDEHYKEGDWILGTWRNHYQWLLSGRSPEKLKEQIMNYGSMHVYDDNFFTSAIVGGVAPIAVGLGMALKKQKSDNKVLCFLGDSAASCGIAMESMRYACGHKLPVLFIIEDNGLSVYTNVQEVFGCDKCKNKNCHLIGENIIYYQYKRKYKHHGTRLEEEKRGELF